MNTSTVRWFVCAAFCVLGAVPVGAQTHRAQSISISAGLMSLDSTVVNNPLRGASAMFHYAFLRNMLSFRIGAAGYRTHGSRTGINCGGPARPDCQTTETFSDSAHAFLFSAGVGARLIDKRRTALTISVDLGRGELRATSFGQTSKGRFDARTLVNTVALAVDGSWLPFERIPVGVQIEGAVGVLHPTGEYAVTDSSEPLFFNDQFLSKRISIGLVWRPFNR